MNPFQVLGVDPGASDDQIEATYRRQLRAHHPDLHQGASADELAAAERRTQELNQAMALIRAGWRPQPGSRGGFSFVDDQPRAGWAPPRGDPVRGYDPPGRPGAWSESFRTDATTDWFGNPQRSRRGPESVACPLCGSDFDDAAVLRLHLGHVHHLRDGTFPGVRPQRRHDDWFRWLRWIPVPQLTLTALLFVYLVVVDGLVPSPWTIGALWLGFGLYALAMTKALWTRRAS